MENIDFKKLFESLPGLNLILAPDFTILTASDSYAKATLTKRDEIIGRNLFEVFPDNPDDPSADGVSNLRESLNRVLKNKKPDTMAVQKYDVRNSDGVFELKYWSPQNKPMFDENNNIVCIIHSAEDVTDFIKMKEMQNEKNEESSEAIRKMEMEIFSKAQDIQKFNKELEQKIAERTEELSRSEKKFRSLVENNENIIALVNERFETIYRSPSSERITGYTNEEISQIDNKQYIHSDDYGKVMKIYKQAFDNPGKSYPILVRIKHKLGHYVLLQGTITNWLNDPDVNGIVTNFHDITKNKNAEDLLKDTGSLAKVGGWELNLNNMTVRWTDEVSRIHELEPGVMPPLEEAINFYAPEARPVIQDAVNKAITDGTSYDLEVPFVTAQGKHLWVRAIGKSDFENGKAVRVYGVFQDITQQKEAKDEIQKLNENLEQKVKERTAQLEAVNNELESFSYSVSHDLRSPLRAINGYAKMLEEDFANVLDGEGNRMLKVIKDNAKNMGLLIDDLLDFSKLGRKELYKTDTDMNWLTGEAIAEINKTINHNAELKIKSLRRIKADPLLIKQVMINLISNAIKYSSKVPKPIVEINSEEQGEEILYSVKDNGAGFDMKFANKLFGVFERLHPASEFEGTGVGLALVKRIILKHGGSIKAEGKINEGASFYFTLPKN